MFFMMSKSKVPEKHANAGQLQYRHLFVSITLTDPLKAAQLSVEM